MESIEALHQAIQSYAEQNNFCDPAKERDEEFANSFIESFAMEHNLTWHTVRPMCWRFNSEDNGEIADGLIELDPGNCQFTCVNVADAKLVDD